MNNKTNHYSNYHLYLRAFREEERIKQELEDAKHALKVYSDRVQSLAEEVSRARSERWKAETRFVAHG